MTTVNLFAAPAATLAASTVAFIDANKASDNASTPFARSSLATIIGGVASKAMVESLVVAAFGSPKGKNGKPVSTVSALRDMDGGARLYQAWKAVAFIVENIDADAPADHVNAAGETVTVGDGAIRKAVTGFVLSDSAAPSALFGATGIAAAVKAGMAAHNVAIAALQGVTADETGEGEGDKGEATDATPVQTLADRAAIFLLALQSAPDADIVAALPALNGIADWIDAHLASEGEANVVTAMAA